MPTHLPRPLRADYPPKRRFFTARTLANAFTLGAVLSTGYWALGATTLIWDNVVDSGAADDGLGTWSTSSVTRNWWNGSADVLWTDSTPGSPVFAQFGAGGTSTTKTVTVSGTVTVAGLSFAAVGGTAPAYTLTGGTIALADNGTITLADSVSTSGSFVTLTSALSGNNITIQKGSGSAEQFLQLSGTNDFTGKLTIAAGNGSLFVRTTGSGAVNSPTAILNTIEVQSGNTLSLQGNTNTYTSNFLIAGTGSATRGAIRFDNNMTLSGTITLAANSVLNFQNSTPTASNVLFTGAITETGGSFSFTKTGLGTLTLRGASNYTGATIVAPAGAGNDPGTLLLDFANSATTDNLLYNGVASGALTLGGNAVRTGGAASTGTLAVTGKSSTTNSQAFNGVAVTGPTAITATSGTGGTVNLTLGAITRTGAGATLAITGPVSGSITTTTNIGTLLGTWTSYNNAGTTTWAGSAPVTGALGNFTGDTTYSTGANLTGSTANYTISSASTGAVAQAAGSTTINTISMTDTTTDRVVTVGTGNTLVLGNLGGIQLVAGAKNLTVGASGAAGTLTAGTAATELAFSNFDATSRITINSVIANNVGALTVVSNGPGTTVLAGANTYTGSTLINSGIVEARHATALGSAATGNTTVAAGAVLQLSGNITIGELVTIYGTGISSGGALRNVSGNNTFGGVITLGSGGAKISADAGSSLTLFRTSAATTVINGITNNVTFGGAGTITVGSVIATTTGTVTKADSGTLILSAANTYTGSTAINGGVVRVTNALGLGTAAAGTTISTGAALELSNAANLTMTEALGLNGTGVNNGGALRNVSGNNTYTALVTLGSASRINADAGTTLTFDVASGNAISGTFGVTFGGAGNIVLTDAVASSAVSKDGTGTLSLAASNIFADTASLSVNNGVLALGAFSDTVGAVTLQNGAITGTGTLTGTGYTVQNGTISANLAGASAALTKTTSGTVTVSGTNTYGGAISSNAGRLILDYSSGTPAPAANAVNLGGGILEMKGNGGATSVGLGTLTTTASTGLSTLTVDANVAVTATTVVRNSTTALLIDLSATGSSLKFTGAPVVNNGVLTGASNAAIVMKDANGRYDFAALDGTNSVVRLNAPGGALPTSGGTTAVSRVLNATGIPFQLTGATNAATLRIDTTTAGGSLDLNGNTLTLGLFGLLVDGSNDYTITNTGGTGSLAGASAVFIYQFGTGKLTLNAPISNQAFLMGNGLIDWTAAAGSTTANYIFGATVRLSGTAITLSSSDVTSTGTGVLNLGNGGILELASGDFTRAVGVSVNNVNFQADGAGFSASGAERKVNLGGAGATLTFGVGSFLSSGNKLILGSPYANATVDFQNNLNLAGATQYIDVQSANITGVGGKISGNITGTGASSLTKIGQGILTLTGANSYSGSTNVNAGTLVVSGSIGGNTSVNVAGGATLNVVGAGTVSADTLGLADTSTLSLEIAALTSTKVTLTSAATFAGHVNLSLALNADPTDGTLFTLIDGGSAVLGLSGTSLFYYNGLALGEGSLFTVNSGSFSQAFQISYVGGSDGSDVTLLAVVPEPGTFATLFAATGMLVGLRRFRRRMS